ncbi:MAG TPA: 4-hydroxythreonine-4-phosphate dehydrogenase PdxA [Stellaceae bacterium]|nr:4-hydroxythreonine-4-phosphate dehydrogenase PdxA [Stellaceae bacterium]
MAIAIGDPAGIGSEIVLKALCNGEVRRRCAAVMVGDAALVQHAARQFGIDRPIKVARTAADLAFPDDAIEILHVPGLDMAAFRFGAQAPGHGRALLAYAEAAIGLAQDGVVGAVVAAPHDQTSVHRDGIGFDGYPGFLARITRTPEDEVYLMAASERFRIAHVTLHLSVRDALTLVTRARIIKVIRAADAALRRMGIARPVIGVSGLNPHAGEHGLFGREEETEIGPAIADARALGIDADGPFGADVMLARGGRDAYVVMLHDQGHIPIKLEPGSAVFSIGAPVLFASVAHGSAHDIAGQGIADPSSLINAIRWCAAAAQVSA